MRNNKKRISLAEMRSIQLDILKVVHDFCVKEGIRYSLGGGSLLGAIRHHGYIPWDDDIDIMMPRPDYDRFVKSFEGFHSICQIQTCFNDDTYFYPFAKVFDNRTVAQEMLVRTGVFIDVCPIDGLPDRDSTEMYLKELTRIIYKELYYSAKTYKIREGNKALLFLKYLVKRCMVPNRKKCLSDLNSLVYSYDFNISEYAGGICGRNGMREHMPASVFKEYIPIRFEGIDFMAIKEYDFYLKSLYNEYMKLPPEEERTAHHNLNVYWK